MAKFSFQQAASALGSLWVGQQQGKHLAREQERQEQDDSLRLLSHLSRMEQDQQAQELEAARFPLTIPGQTEESLRLGAQQYAAKQAEISGRPRPGNDLMRGVIQRRFPGASLTPRPMTPTTAPTFTPQFKPPGEDEASAAVEASLRASMEAAQREGDEEGALRARELLIKLARKAVTPEQASAEAGLIDTQGRVSADERKRAEQPFATLADHYARQAYKPEYTDRIGALVQKYQSIPPYGKQRAAALQALLPELQALGAGWRDLDPAAKVNLENARTSGKLRLMSEYQGLLKSAAGAKNPAQAQVFLQQASQLAQTPEGRAAGIAVPEAFDPTPQVIPGGGFEEVGFDLPDRTETPAEVRVRQQVALTQFMEDPAEQRKALEKSAAALWGALKSGHLKSGSIANVLDQLNDVHRRLGVPVVIPKDAWDALTPMQQEQVKARNETARLSRQRFGLDQQKFKLDQEQNAREAEAHRERIKSGYYKKQGSKEGEVSERDQALLRDLQERRKAAAAIVEDYNAAATDMLQQSYLTPEMKQRADAAQAELPKINAAIRRITGEAGPAPQQTGPPYKPGQFSSGKGAKQTPQQRRAEFVATMIKEGNKTPAQAEAMANRLQWR